jgi:putative methyltransferase
LQEKSSCFPAVALSPPLGSHVIDACAGIFSRELFVLTQLSEAPGNKTTHLSAIMQNTGQIHAFDMDSRRLETLRRHAKKAKCTNILATCRNFLDVDYTGEEYQEVEYILLDPSCSGSGIVSRMDALIDKLDNNQQDGEDERLKSLSDFQVAVIEHALKFPRVKRIVYSTCSIHEIENEQVVARILQNHHAQWQLEKILPFWNHRGNILRESFVGNCGGLTGKELAEFVVRCSPQDGTNGFFVSCFTRR